MGGQNSVKKFLVFPSGVEPALESLHEWGVDNLWRQRVPAVHDSDSEGEHFVLHRLVHLSCLSFYNCVH